MSRQPATSTTPRKRTSNKPKRASIVQQRDPLFEATYPLDRLTLWDRNYNRHPHEQVERLAASLHRWGQVKNIVVWERPDGQTLVVGGAGLVTAARFAGEPSALKATAFPASWPEDEVVAYLVADNELARLSDPDEAQLAALLQEQANAGYDLLSIGYTADDLDALLQRLADETLADAGAAGRDVDDPAGGGDDFDATPDESGPTRCQPGDLWQLGKHRLLCGDSTHVADVLRLMDGETLDLIITDPPYGVSYADKNRFLNAIAPGNRIQKPIANDHGDINAIAENVWRPAFTTMHEVAREGCVIYCCAPQGGDQMMMMMMHAHWPVRHELIWLKNNHVLGRADYAYKHEPILYAWKGVGHKYYGGFQTSVLEFARPQKSDLHPTMKPVALIAHLMENNSVEGERVGDWFAGSGTTLIAAERLGRRCCAIEIDSHYADVIIRRWETESGQIAVRLTTAESPQTTQIAE